MVATTRSEPNQAVMIRDYKPLIPVESSSANGCIQRNASRTINNQFATAC
jgi:hypothetical protein